jgi:hypothetical protein
LNSQHSVDAPAACGRASGEAGKCGLHPRTGGLLWPDVTTTPVCRQTEPDEHARDFCEDADGIVAFTPVPQQFMKSQRRSQASLRSGTTSGYENNPFICSRRYYYIIPQPTSS